MKFDFERGGQYHKTLTIQYILYEYEKNTYNIYIYQNKLCIN